MATELYMSHFSVLTLLVDHQWTLLEEHPPVKIDCWYVDGDDLTGALHVL